MMPGAIMVTAVAPLLGHRWRIEPNFVRNLAVTHFEELHVSLPHETIMKRQGLGPFALPELHVGHSAVGLPVDPQGVGSTCSEKVGDIALIGIVWQPPHFYTERDLARYIVGFV